MPASRAANMRGPGLLRPTGDRRSVAWSLVMHVALLMIILLGGVGASARVWLTQAGETRLPGGAPMATGIINVVGAGLLGGHRAVGAVN